MIRSDVMKAIKMDSVLVRQINMLNEAIENARINNQKMLEGELRLISYQLRASQPGGRVDKSELISYIAVPLYLGGAYQRADSVAKVYSTQAPDSIHGYYWSALALSAIDTSMTQGLAIPDYEKVLTIAETGKDRFRSQGVKAATTLAIYHNNIKGDRNTALSYIARGLAFDPTNANLLNIQKVLTPAQRPGPKQPAPKTETKTKTGDTKVKTEGDKTKVKKETK
jgi:hypothetical protein